MIRAVSPFFLIGRDSRGPSEWSALPGWLWALGGCGSRSEPRLFGVGWVAVGRAANHGCSASAGWLWVAQRTTAARRGVSVVVGACGSRCEPRLLGGCGSRSEPRLLGAEYP